MICLIAKHLSSGDNFWHDELVSVLFPWLDGTGEELFVAFEVGI